MDFVGTCCQTVQCLWPALSGQLSYVTNLKKNFTKLNKEIIYLNRIKEDVLREINKDKRWKVPSKESEGWLEEVEQITKQLNEIEAEVNANKRCLDACCFPDIVSRMKLGKRIVNLLSDVSVLKETATFKGAVMVDAPVRIIEKVPTPIIEGQTSFHRLVKHVMKRMRNETTKKIGLWGNGSSKTMVMKIINNLPELEQEFDIVIWVTVTINWSVRKVQDKIGQRLHISRDSKESDGRFAERLNQKLESMKYLLLLDLDDNWNLVNLDDVGIPTPNTETGSKILLTAQYQEICKEMGTDVQIKVEVLSKDEAWSLFQHKVGEAVKSPNIEPIARCVVEECDGMPLAILVVGGCLKNVKDALVWKNTLEELRSTLSQFVDLEDLVFKKLTFSFDQLENDDVKNCFLYCGLYPENDMIPAAELVEHWRAEGFINGMSSLDMEYNKGHAILDSLRDRSLLERDGNYITLHKELRDFALKITSPQGEGPRFFVRAGVRKERCPEIEELENIDRISLMDNNLRILPASPRCYSLSTLLLQKNRRLETIPELFFQHMHSLRVLNLCNTDLLVIPPSVSKLVNLRGLYLKGFPPLGVLPSEIGALERLEVLYIAIEALPREVRQLTGLRSFHVQFEGIQPMRTLCSKGVLSSLLLLEDLRISFSYQELFLEWCDMVDVTVAGEVGSLKYLTSLIFEFSRIECFEYFVKQRHLLHCSMLREFDLSISSWKHTELKFGQEIGKELRWHHGEGISSGVIQVLHQACYFELCSHKTAQTLVEFGNQNLNKLQICKVLNCTKIETIVDGTCSADTVLPKLEKLYLGDLPNLMSISDQDQVFINLTYLEIYKCSKLKYVFTRRLTEGMSNLEELTVKSCQEIETIVTEEAVKGDLFFPRLKLMKLSDMNNLKSVLVGEAQLWPSLRNVTVMKCQQLKSLKMKTYAQRTKTSVLRIEGSQEWWEALEWEHDGIKQRIQFQPIKEQPIMRVPTKAIAQSKGFEEV